MGTVKVVWLSVVATLLILQKQHIAADQECDDEGGCKLALPVVDYDFEYDEESPLGSIISSQKSLPASKTQDTPSQKYIISGNGSHVLAHFNPADFSDEEGAATRFGGITFKGMFGKKDKSASRKETATQKPEKKKKFGFAQKISNFLKSDSSKSDKKLSPEDKKKEKKENKSLSKLFNMRPKDKKETKPKTPELSKMWNKEMNRGSKSVNSTAKAEKPKKKKTGYLGIFNFRKKKNGTLAEGTKPKKPKTESKKLQKIISLFKKDKNNPNNSSEVLWPGQEPKKKRKGMKKVKHVAKTVLKKLIETARTLWEKRKDLMENLPYRMKNATIGRISRVIEARLNISIDLMEGWDAFAERIAGCAEEKQEYLEVGWKRIDDETLKCAGKPLKAAAKIMKEFKQIGLRLRGMKKAVKTNLTNCVLGITPGGVLDLGDEKVSRDELAENLPNAIVLHPKDEGWAGLDEAFEGDSGESDDSLGGETFEETDLSSEQSDDDDDNDNSVKAHSVIRRDLMDMFTNTVTCGATVFRDAINEVTAMPGKIVSLVEAGAALLQNDGRTMLDCFSSVIRKERKTLDNMAAIMGACAIMGV